MSTEEQKEEFSFGWLALKLLGKSLYSNAWSAISELVANGFDANATKVYVFIDATNKNDATIEIIDNGAGMDNNGIKTYVRVGFNKRLEPRRSTEDDYLIMGRKGIGKLAALYLSERYYLLTRTGAHETKWQMKYQENAEDENEKPFLSEINDDIEIKCKGQWDECSTGTLLQMNHVNLTGLGEVAYDALSRKLANHFALDAMGNREILLCVNEDERDVITFQAVKKEIAFKNMAFIDYDAKETGDKIPELDEVKNAEVKFPYTKLNGSQTYKHPIETEDFDSIEHIDVSGTINYQTITGNTIEKPYTLKGWVGLHSTIDERLAKEHDERFSRTKFYNPIQLRLYVRNKLAVENFLNVINNTQAFVSYIEGEIHFDILDDDDLPDIATSNRQNLAEHDERVQLLVSIIKKIVTNLITKRTDLANIIKKQEEELQNKQDANAKKQFTREVETEVDSIGSLTQSEKSSLTTIITNKIRGDVVPKSDYIVFLSHSSKDKIITNFIYQLLKSRGAIDTEFFYTSRDDTVEQYDNLDSLAIQIKNNFLKENVLLLYLTSNAYKNSEFCMFEGGAGWATRSVGEYIVLSLTHEEIPQFITNGKLEFCIERNRAIELDRQTYLFLRGMLNHMIEHLNAGRYANADTEIRPFDESDIPSDLQLSQQRKAVIDYMDKDIIEHWNFYVGENLMPYLKERYNKDETD